jgi:RHS repeat-associated protein
MGSNVNEFDSAKNTTMTKDYDAFGNVKSMIGLTTNRFGYASSWGYQSDAGSGLELLDNRYYDPTIGRFLTKDPKNPSAPGQPGNTYPQRGDWHPYSKKHWTPNK